MKIENEIIEFIANAEEKLQLSSLQKQYFAELKLKSSIFNLVKQAAQRGWLVNFKELYALLNECVAKDLILNKSVVDYFKSLEMAQQKTQNKHKQTSGVRANGSIDNIIVHLRNSSFFRSIDESVFSALTADCQFLIYKPEEMICEENDNSRDLYYLYSGQVGVYKTVDGKRRFVSLLNEGTVFGETAFFLGHKRTADLVALKETRVIQIRFKSDYLAKVLNEKKAQTIIERFWVQHALVNSEIFKNLPPDCFDSMVSIGSVRNFKNQSVVFSQNDIGEKAYCVIQGSLAVLQNEKHIQTLSQGSFFGELALIVSGGRRTATIVCTSDVTVLEIPQVHFYQLLAANLFLAKEIQNIAEERLKKDQMRKTG